MEEIKIKITEQSINLFNKKSFLESNGGMEVIGENQFDEIIEELIELFIKDL
jgi:hypothetical protein